MTKVNGKVTDRNRVSYELKELIGRGGQGCVYSVVGGRLAVKIIHGATDIERERLRNQLMYVRRLPLDGFPLARPMETLSPPHTGYIMELLTGMVPLDTLIEPPRDTAISLWYLNTGGLRRRLLVLASAAHTLSRLHAKGLVYSDPSPHNILISEDVAEQEVWLIDADNITSQSIKGVFTPGFGAPELVNGTSGVTSLSDAFSFAVLAYQTLTLIHPFIGDVVNNGDPELEWKAYAGELPWVDDASDISNKSSFGIPRDRVLSTRLFEMFQKTFGLGRLDRMERPGIDKWTERLFTAADATLKCDVCGATYYFNSSRCPWCGARHKVFAVASFYLWNPEGGSNSGIVMKNGGSGSKPMVMSQGSISDGDTFIIRKRHAIGFGSKDISDPMFSATLKGQLITLKSLDGRPCKITINGSRKTSLISDDGTTIDLERNRGIVYVHLGNDDTPHVVVSFDLRKDVKE